MEEKQLLNITFPLQLMCSHSPIKQNPDIRKRLKIIPFESDWIFDPLTKKISMRKNDFKNIY